ncbi:hypothetical protein [Halomicrococcus sp. NG-SE-24]|uniref:hypothetical protein n=1 Tax=Halomicrococcus sp. NG-SE-24 TaxID=3436928 RepID=UPI003D96C631
MSVPPINLYGRVWIAGGVGLVALMAILAIFQPMLAYLVALVVAYTVLILTNKRLDFFTPSYLFAAVYGLFLTIGSAWYSFRGDPALFSSIVLGFAAFVAGVYTVDKTIDFHTTVELQRFLDRPWKHSWTDPAPRLAFIGLVATTLLGSSLYYFTYGIPILSQIGEASRLSSLSGQDYYIHFIMVPLPFLATIAWLKARLSDNRLYFASAIVILGITGAVMALTGFRALIGHLLILLVISDQFITRRINFPIIGAAAVAFLSLFLLITTVRHQSVDGTPLAIAGQHIRHRIFLVNSENLRFVLGHFPAEHSYLLGQGYIMDLQSMLPGPQKAFSGWITQQRWPGLKIPIGMTPTIIGESYANFGYMGVIAVPFLVGATIRAIFVRLVRSRKRIGTVAFVAMLALFFAKAVLRGMGPILFVKILPLALVYVILEVLAFIQPIRYLQANSVGLR